MRSWPLTLEIGGRVHRHLAIEVSDRLRLTNGRLRTMDAARPVASDLLIEDGLIVDVLGLGAELPTESSWQVVDLEGATVLPAFIDAHLHLTQTGLQFLDLDLSEVS